MSGILVFGALGAIYGLINLALPHIPAPIIVKTYVLQPVLWGLLGWLVLALPRYRLATKSRLKSTIIGLALVIGFVQIVAYAIGGLFSSFGKNPSSLTPLGIITNLVFVGSMLMGMELSRAWLINRLAKHHAALALALVSLVYTLLSIPLAQLTGLKLQIESVTRVNSVWLPLLAENLLASLLARFAGAPASLAYRAVLAAFWWLCPILPDLPWSLKGLIGAAIPIMGMLAVNSFHAAETGRGKPRRQARESAFPAGWIITAIVSVVIVWFAVGLFPFQSSLVGSGSMRPVMDVGDIVIVAKVPPSAIKVGDVIQFRKPEKITILHRVIKIEEMAGAKFFRTKGDANNAPDIDLVPPQNVVGKVVFVARKVGWLAIAVKKFFTI